MILFALRTLVGNSLQTYLAIFKREKSMISSLKQVKCFSDQKMIIVSAMKNSCGQLFLIGRREKSITSLLRQVIFFSDKSVANFICNEELLWTTLCDLIW